jgi:hypothetical protein
MWELEVSDGVLAAVGLDVLHIGDRQGMSIWISRCMGMHDVDGDGDGWLKGRAYA